jgi:ABC-2 type transport system ATP-binding protein
MQENDSPAPRSEAIPVSVRGLVKRYRGFVAVERLDMDVRRGEVMGLLGPNGAGKSTVLKCISGIQFPTEGTILINGIDSRNHKEAMAKVGCVIETPIPNPAFTPMETLAYVGRMHGMGKREAFDRSKEVLEELGIWPWRDKSTGGFSKGMKQRVAIAAALVHDPDVILLDEPTSGLDPRGVIEMRQILSNLKRRGTAIVISTHILKEASELCTSMTMIDHGQKIVGGRMDEVVRRINGGSVLEVQTAKDVPSGFISDLAALPGVSSPETTGTRSFRLRFNGTAEQRATIADLIHSSGLMLLSMKESDDSFESLYMSLTEKEEANAS